MSVSYRLKKIISIIIQYYLWTLDVRYIMHNAHPPTLPNICSISIDSESKTCSLSNGDVSADVLDTDELPILLYATNFKSISFSNFRACFRRTEHKDKFNEPKFKFEDIFNIKLLLTIPFRSTHRNYVIFSKSQWLHNDHYFK